MTAQIAAHGRLVADVRTKTTSNDKHMAFTRLAVPVPCRTAENGEVTLWLAVLAFGKQADALARHQKGDLVSVSGTMQVNQWTAQDGGTQQGWQIVADSVISARTVRPGGKSASQRGSPQQPQQQGQQTAPGGWAVYQTPEDEDQTPTFDDSVPF